MENFPPPGDVFLVMSSLEKDSLYVIANLPRIVYVIWLLINMSPLLTDVDD